jgi:putative PIN family toxin of toxin-antitoxin system
VLVSSPIRRGKPRELWNKVLEDKIKLVMSDDLLTEFVDAISRPRFRRYIKRNRLKKFRRVLLQKAEFSTVKIHLPQVTVDPDDNIVVETAYSANAKYIVSGDKHLLTLMEFKGIKVVTIDQMLKILEGKD